MKQDEFYKMLMDGLLITIAFMGIQGLEFFSKGIFDYAVYGFAVVTPLVIFGRRKFIRYKERRRLLE